MHYTHKHHHHHEPESDQETGDLKKLLVMLYHWIEHDNSHAAGYRQWADKASVAGEEEIAKEIHLAIDDGVSVRNHLKRAKAILAEKLTSQK